METVETIGLVMIVKNEAHILPRLADSLKDKISHFVILDCGSRDGTPELARSLFGNVPGVVLEPEVDVAVVGYAACRNRALAVAETQSDWLLSLDADETLEGEFTLPDRLTVDAVEVEMRYRNMRYWVPRIFASGRGWQWEGRAHEYLSLDGAKTVRTESCWIVHHADGGNHADKSTRELELLHADWNERPDARTAFYLARGYDDLGQPEAIEWYRRRLAMPGWEEETFYATYRLGVNLLRFGPTDMGIGTLWRAWGMRPYRAEPLVALAEHYRHTDQWNLAWLAWTCFRQDEVPGPGDLFVDADADWKIYYEASIAAFYVGQLEIGKDCICYLLDQDVPEPYHSSVLSNATFYP